jgi:hypothetical protein
MLLIPQVLTNAKDMAELCQGDVSKLPSFMVHDNAVWRSGVVQPDSKGRVHLARSTFDQQVVGHLPLRAGVWHGPDVQEFHIDLQPHHLQGGKDTKSDVAKVAPARHVAKTDEAHRRQDEVDYGADLGFGRVSAEDAAADRAAAQKAGTSRSVKIAALVGPRDENE